MTTAPEFQATSDKFNIIEIVITEYRNKEMRISKTEQNSYPTVRNRPRPVVPKVGGGITEVGATRYERWKGALLLSEGGASRQVVHLFL
jgi:hypothetical protein